ncbi:uncharacterized protein [Primulina huaijiensis]|uniref:uncharacterized protein n=1 Tax=Primulina huaijiensis TaxID=1492673 RepID=UPI003CC74F4D
MDYGLAALKLLCVHLRRAAATTSQNAYTLGGILFQRAWLQGVLVSTAESDEGGGGRYLLDDGTGVIELFLSGDFRSRRLEKGMYIMVVGGYSLCAGDLPMIKVHKLVDLSAFPDRESMWYLEVMETFKLFYQPMFQH